MKHNSASIRTAIIGYGRSGATLHADPIEASDEFNLVAVADPDKGQCAKAQKRFNCSTYTNYQELLKKEKIELAVIVARSDQHCCMSCDCLEGGVHVLVTKPWALNETEAHTMIQTAKKNKKLLLPWLPARWGADFLRLKQLINAGTVGKVFCIQRREHSFAVRHDWQTEKKYGGGSLLNWGAHVIDVPLLLVDSAVKTVYGQLRQVMNPGNAEDLFSATLVLHDETIVQAEYTISAEKLLRWIIQGTKGTITADDGEIIITTGTPADPKDPTRKDSMVSSKKKSVKEKIVGPLYGDAHSIYHEVAQAVKGNTQFPVSTKSALCLTKILDAIRVSGQENRVIEMEEKL